MWPLMQSISIKSENSTRFPDDDMLKFPSSKLGGGYFCQILGCLNVHPNVPRCSRWWILVQLPRWDELNCQFHPPQVLLLVLLTPAVAGISARNKTPLPRQACRDRKNLNYNRKSYSGFLFPCRGFVM